MSRAEVVRILHISDTHGLHASIELQHPLPDANILIHTGDFTNVGDEDEFQDFNSWLGSLRSRYKHRIVIFGNHEWAFLQHLSSSEIPGPDLQHRIQDIGAFARSQLTNATAVLEHETIEIMGLKIFGSAWCPWALGRQPDKVGTRPGFAAAHTMYCGAANHPTQPTHRFDEIPEGMDILLTHGPPYGIFDRMETTWEHWGGSEALVTNIRRAKPKCHLFGHLHEQRGVWSKDSANGQFSGGVEYQMTPGQAWETFPPPNRSYPCQLISNNAMKNHPGMEGYRPRIAGPGRLIVARRASPSAEWSFGVA